MSIEHMNYWNDSRVQAAMRHSEDYEEVDGKIFFELGCEEDENRLLLPCKLEQCHTCSGKGTHVNPSIDAGGLSQEDFDREPDFKGEYLSGMYDVRCYECKGVKQVLAVDYDVLDDTAKKRYDDHCEEERHYQDICAGERRMGA